MKEEPARVEKRAATMETSVSTTSPGTFIFADLLQGVHKISSWKWEWVLPATILAVKSRRNWASPRFDKTLRKGLEHAQYKAMPIPCISHSVRVHLVLSRGVGNLLSSASANQTLKLPGASSNPTSEWPLASQSWEDWRVLQTIYPLWSANSQTGSGFFCWELEV